MKKYLLLLLALVCLLSLSGCGCKHENWVDANCTAPKTCAACGETEGAPLGHSWLAATCDTAKTCEVCGVTEGEPLGHDFGDDAPGSQNCEYPRACIRCSQAEREAKPHDWVDATTEAPKTCTVCGMIEGEKIITDPRFTTAACQDLFGTWEGEYIMTGEMMGDATLPDMPVILGITFHNDGTYTESVRMVDKEGYAKLMKDYYIQALYAEFEGQYGMTKEQADQAMVEAYGMDVEGYAEVMAAAIDWNALLEASSQEGVYYVAEGKLYSGPDWDTLEEEELRLEKSTLTLSVADLGEVVLTRVK